MRDPQWLIAEAKRWHIFENFMKENLVLTKEYDSWESIKQDLPDYGYDAIIVGGDQVWNTSCFDFDWAYYLPGTIGSIKKIAFSPSFGNSIPYTKSNADLVIEIRKYLEDFDFISVRESDASAFLHGLLNKDIPVVLDPAFLLDSSKYLQPVVEPIVSEPYIYYYSPALTADYDAEDIAVELANKLGLRIITSYPRYGRRTPMKTFLSGPTEFLNLISNAKIVIGKSFHLVVFSVLFHREFITVNFKKDARVDTLLNDLGISGRNILSADEYESLTKVDYAIVDRELSRLKQRSMSFLREAIDSCVTGV